MKKALRALINVISLILAVAAMAIILPRIFGIRAFGVLSGSMEPAISVGSMVYAVPTEQSKIQVGDVITYVLDQSGTVVTHRVVAIDEETGDYAVQGDANNTADANPVVYENVVGVVKVHIPLVGYAIGFALTTAGKIVVITLIIVLLLLMVLLKDDEADAAEKQRAAERKAARNGVAAPAAVAPAAAMATAAAPAAVPVAAAAALPLLGPRVYDSSRRYVARHPA